MKVTIVPVGLNYFKGHRFRSRVFVDIGEPIVPSQEQLAAFKKGGTDKRGACEDLLKAVTTGLRGVTVEAPDYDTLQFFRLMRRLYVPERAPGEKITAKSRFALIHQGFPQFHRLRKSPSNDQSLRIAEGAVTCMLFQRSTRVSKITPMFRNCTAR